MSKTAARIVRAVAVHMKSWAQMRAALWRHASISDHWDDIADMLAASANGVAAFVSSDGQGDIVAFVEAALRCDRCSGGMGLS